MIVKFNAKIIMNNSELLKGLSIEELQDRAEFAAAAEGDKDECVICSC